MTLTKTQQIDLRADEDIIEFGTIDAAIAANCEAIASGDYPAAFTRFIRLVNDRLHERSGVSCFGCEK